MCRKASVKSGARYRLWNMHHMLSVESEHSQEAGRKRCSWVSSTATSTSLWPSGLIAATLRAFRSNLQFLMQALNNLQQQCRPHRPRQHRWVQQQEACICWGSDETCFRPIALGKAWSLSIDIDVRLASATKLSAVQQSAWCMQEEASRHRSVSRRSLIISSSSSQACSSIQGSPDQPLGSFSCI